MDDTSKLSIDDALTVLEDLVKKHLKKTGNPIDTVVLFGGTALAALSIREKSGAIDIYVSYVDDDAVNAVTRRHAKRFGPDFKIDATPSNTIFGAIALQDIGSSPIGRTLNANGHIIKIRALSVETLYIIKTAANQEKDLADIKQIGKRTNYSALLKRTKDLLSFPMVRRPSGFRGARRATRKVHSP